LLTENGIQSSEGKKKNAEFFVFCDRNKNYLKRRERARVVYSSFGVAGVVKKRIIILQAVARECLSHFQSALSALFRLSSLFKLHFLF